MRTRRLIVQAPEGERELLFVGRLTVGRAPECDISVADTKISRRHAEFDATGPVPRVADLGSRNGILVNGRKVAGADLSTGDVVTVGDLRIRFEEVVSAAPPARTVDTADRTAVLPMPTAPPAPRPAAAAAMPAGAAAVRPGPHAASGVDDLAPVALAPPPVVAGHAGPAPPHVAAAVPSVMASDDRTAVLPRPVMPSARPAGASAPSASPPAADDRTAVIPRPPMPAAPPAGASPSRPAAAAVVPAAPATHVAPSPAPAAAPSPAPVAAAPPSVPPRAVQTVGTSVPPDVPSAPVPIAAQPAVQAAAPGAAASASTPVGRGPRFSWGGLVILACVALGGLGVLLGALPLMSASSTTIDQLSRRQVRTLGGWAASAVRPDGSVDEGTLADVLSQPGVESATVLDVQSGRAMAPARLIGRTFDTLPVVGAEWRTFRSPTVTVSTGYADAFVPVTGGTARYLAWVRYSPPSASENGVAVIVGLLSTLVLALLTAMMIRRHTAATMQHFTRQVELVVSGANPKVMDGRLLPGAERLPGVVTYLLEQRRAAAWTAGGPPVATPVEAPLPASDARISDVAPPVPSGPPWIEVTPSLSVVGVSAHAPDGGVRDWTTASGRHLLDVLEPGPLCNAVVQGLGALGATPGAEVTVPVPDHRPVTLRRETSTHVRVELAMR